jgi:hypothetical protein
MEMPELFSELKKGVDSGLSGLGAPLSLRVTLLSRAGGGLWLGTDHPDLVQEAGLSRHEPINSRPPPAVQERRP